MSYIGIFAMGGAVTRVSPDETAIGRREIGFEVNLVGAWSPAGTEAGPKPDRHVAWVREGWETLRPYSTGVYANFLSDEGAAGVEFSYGDRLKRLTALKDAYDPDNVFRLNANIAPTAGRRKRRPTMTRVLVAGATGNVGSRVIRELLDRGVAVRGFARDPRQSRRLTGRRGRHWWSATSPIGRACATPMTGADAVFLSCANHPRQFELETNVIDAAAEAGIGRLVKLSALGARVGSPLEFWDAHARIESSPVRRGNPLGRPPARLPDDQPARVRRDDQARRPVLPAGR